MDLSARLDALEGRLQKVEANHQQLYEVMTSVEKALRNLIADRKAKAEFDKNISNILKMIGVVLAKMQTDLSSLMEAHARGRGQGDDRQRRVDRTEPRGKVTLH
jgi:DNA repair ATPase RecN